MLDSINLEFPVVVYGNLEKYNETISKGRCRVFYKYGNRNGTILRMNLLKYYYLPFHILL